MDNSVRLISVDGAKTLEIARGHCAPVTCVALSPDSNYLVTGSRDATVLLWRLHRVSTSRSGTTVEPSTPSSTPASTSSTTTINTLSEKRRHRIEGPIHVLRGHLGEILCCSVSSDLGIVASCSKSSDVLLHSIKKGRLMRRLVGVEAHAICLSSDGVILAWNKQLNALSTFTLNGTYIARSQLPFSSSISCMEVSVDGHCALIGLNRSLDNDGVYDTSRNLRSKAGNESFDIGLTEENRLSFPLPSICFFDLHSLKVRRIYQSLICFVLHLSIAFNLFFHTTYFKCSIHSSIYPLGGGL